MSKSPFFLKKTSSIFPKNVKKSKKRVSRTSTGKTAKIDFLAKIDLFDPKSTLRPSTDPKFDPFPDPLLGPPFPWEDPNFDLLGSILTKSRKSNPPGNPLKKTPKSRFSLGLCLKTQKTSIFGDVGNIGSTSRTTPKTPENVFFDVFRRFFVIFSGVKRTRYTGIRAELAKTSHFLSLFQIEFFLHFWSLLVTFWTPIFL